MTLITEVRRRETFLEEVQAPLADVLAEDVERGFMESPVGATARIAELRKAEVGDPASLGFEMGDEPQFTGPSSPIVDAETARSRVKEAGLSLDIPDDGLPEDALRILMERKADERRRQVLSARAPTGAGVTALRLGATLAGSLLDPTNIALSFVPVVGPTRYAAMLAKAGGPLGRAGVRVGVGALEGAAGAAIAEPLIAGAAAYEQADYDAVDSLINIGLGTVLGGGLHVGAGAVADALRRGRPWQTAKAIDPLPRVLEEMDPATREAALRAAVAQAASGRAVDVEAVLRIDPAWTAEPLPVRGAFSLTEDPGAVRDARTERIAEAEAQVVDLERRLSELPPAPAEDMLARAARVEEVEAQLRNPDLTGPERKALNERRDELMADVRDTDLRAARKTAEDRRAVEAQIDGLNRRIEEERAAVTEGAVGIEGLAREGRPDLQAIARGVERMTTPDDRLRAVAAGAARMATPQGMAGLSAAAKAADAPESVALADFAAARQAEETTSRPVAETPETVAEELQDALDDAERLTVALGTEGVVAREMKPLDELSETADAYARAIEAAAACGLRRGT